MPARILHAATRAAHAAAATQVEQCEAVRSAFTGNVTLRIEGAGGQHLRTMTLGPFSINTATPRALVCGAVLADTAVAPAAPGAAGIAPVRWEFRNGSTPIFDSDEIVQGPMRTLCQPRFASVAFTANPALPVTPQPNSLLNLFVAARAAVAATEWTWVQASTNTFASVLPPVGLRDNTLAAGEGLEDVITAWGGWVWNPDALAFEYNGTGHSAGGHTEWFRWSAMTRQHSLSYYGARMIACPAPFYRAADFNLTPPSAHAYDNQCYGRVRKRVYQAYAGTFNSGFGGRVWRTNESGTQSNGADGLPGANYTGIFEIDMSQAGAGKVLGETGSNAAWGANAGTVLPGAQAALLHDWYGTGGARPIFDGLTVGPEVESSFAYTDEVAGKDAFFWTGAAKHLVLTTVNSANPADDTHQLVAVPSSAYGQARGSVQASLDPTRRVVVVITNDQDTNPGCVAFADLKRTWGASNGWRQATLTGADIAEFLALNRLDMGIQYDPISGKHLAYNGLGRQVWAITPPAGNPTPDTGWVLEKLPMNAAQPAPPTTPDPRQAIAGEQIIGVNGKWKHADELRAHGFIEGQLAGNVWFLLGPGWTDPRNT